MKQQTKIARSMDTKSLELIRQEFNDELECEFIAKHSKKM